MIQKQRVLNTFLDMVKISSPSGNERRMADYLINHMNANGIEVYEDKAGETIRGNTGNVIAKIKGNGKKHIVLTAHMDTVVPCDEIHPVIDGDIVKTDGTSVLGGDDKSGIAAILELIQQIRAESIDHPDLTLIFSIAEETGLYGAKAIDESILKDVDCAFVLDSSGHTGEVIYTAPYSAGGKLIVHGKEAHAGVAPEKGVNALVVAAHAISKLDIGRIDEETTCNIGKIEGGLASNIVMPKVEMVYEARSLSKQKLDDILKKTMDTFKVVCEECHATFETDVKVNTSGYAIDQHTEFMQALKNACDETGITYTLKTSMGGSDANIYNEKGIPAVVLATGMSNVHTVHEYIDMNDVNNLSQLLVNLMKSL